MNEYFLILFGLLLLFLGGDSLIRGAVSVARNLKISKFLVSSVIIGFGTSMPEMTVSIKALSEGNSQVALGNVIGSNIANILLILGLSALISGFRIKDHGLRRDTVMMLSATIFFCFIGFTYQKLNAYISVFMIVTLCVYIYFSYVKDRENYSKKQVSNIETDLGVMKNANLITSFIVAIVGMLILIYGAKLFLEGSISLATKYDISDEIIGLVIVAVGSCLPELATAIIASIRKHANVALASIIGSNIFNIMSITAVMGLIEEITFSPQFIGLDLWILLIATIILSALLLKNIKFGKRVGVGFLISYLIYVQYLL